MLLYEDRLGSGDHEIRAYPSHTLSVSRYSIKEQKLIIRYAELPVSGQSLRALSAGGICSLRRSSTIWIAFTPASHLAGVKSGLFPACRYPPSAQLLAKHDPRAAGSRILPAGHGRSAITSSARQPQQAK